MNVKTDLRAGGVWQNAVDQAGQIAGQTVDFVAAANREAENLTNTVVDTTKSVWYSVTGALGF